MLSYFRMWLHRRSQWGSCAAAPDNTLIQAGSSTTVRAFLMYLPSSSRSPSKIEETSLLLYISCAVATAQ